MTLDQVALRVPVRITGFTALDESQRAQLSGLGLRAGATVTKLMTTPLRDPIECLVGPQLLALERRLLALIRVEAA
ncbi:MAG: ferrous iron transport protein A [Elusimicrobia bacterium]|nr:ferrous iron transport protein A [Elusimicrobiota bacterium]